MCIISAFLLRHHGQSLLKRPHKPSASPCGNILIASRLACKHPGFPQDELQAASGGWDVWAAVFSLLVPAAGGQTDM